MLSVALLSLFAMPTQPSCPLDGINAVRVSSTGNLLLDGLYISFSSGSSSSSSAKAELACRFLRRLPSGGMVQVARHGTFWTISVGSRNIYGVKAGVQRDERGGGIDTGTSSEEGPCAPPQTGWSALGGAPPSVSTSALALKPTVTVVTDAPDSTRAALGVLLGAKRPQQRHRAVACVLASLGERSVHLLDESSNITAVADAEHKGATDGGAGSGERIVPPVAQRTMQAMALHELGWYAEASSLLRDVLRTKYAMKAVLGADVDAARAALVLSLANQGLLSAAVNESHALVKTRDGRQRPGVPVATEDRPYADAGAGCPLLVADLRLLQGSLTDAGQRYETWRSHQKNGPASSGCHGHDVTRLLMGRQHLTGLRRQLMRGRRLLFAHQALAVIELNNLGAQQGALSIVHTLRDGIARSQPRWTQNALALRAALLIPHVFTSASHVDSELTALRKRIKSAVVELRDFPAELPHPGRASHEFWLLLPTTFQLIYVGKSCRRLFESAAQLFLTAFPSVQRTAAWLMEPESDGSTQATAKLAPAPPATSQRVESNSRKNASSAITVGFLSGRFRSHSVARVTRGLIERLAHSPRFRVVVLLSTRFSGNNAHDAVTRAISASAERSVELPGDVDGARQAIERERLDVLVYAELGEVDPFIYSLAFSRLAPIQAKFWGHFATSGLSSIDYYLTADAFAPDRWSPTGDALFTEQLIRLEGMSAYLLPPGTTGTGRGCASVEAQREAYASIAGGKENDAHLYVCLQHLSKFHPQFDEVLRQILRRDKRAHVVLVFQEGWMLWKARLVARFRATLGSAVLRRVHFLPPLSHQQFLALVGAAVVALDTFPIGGCITTLEALGCGTPVVTWPGAMLTEHFAAGMYKLMRVAAEKSVANSSTARLAERSCVATTADDYVRKAVQLGKDTDLRARVSDHISTHEHALYGDTTAVNDWAAFLERAVGQVRSDPRPD